MSRWRSTVVLFVCVAIQVGLFSFLRPFGVAPDLMLVAAIVGGLIGGDDYGARHGFIAGLLFDLVLAGPFGLAAGIYGVIGYGSGLLGQAIDSDDSRILPFGVFLLTMVGTAAYAVSLGLLGAGGLISGSVLWIAFVVAVWAFVFLFPVRMAYGWVASAERRFATGDTARTVVN